MERSKNNDTLYLIHYRDPLDGKVVSLKAKSVVDSSLGLSFVKISGFVFEEDSVLIKPSEEHLKKRLEGVKSLHLSIYSIISIEEVGKGHKRLKFRKDKSNLLVISSPQTTPHS